MKCEEFELIGLDADRRGSARSSADAREFGVAIEHANGCARCAALLQSWRAAQAELQVLRTVTQDAETPSRVEMRLRQEFRQHAAGRRRKVAVISAWALAAAAVLVAVASWWNWSDENMVAKHENKPSVISKPAKDAANGSAQAPVLAVADMPREKKSAPKRRAARSDSANLEDFMLLPGSVPIESGESDILRVRLQRGALGALGLPVNEERAEEWVLVDLLVTEDGQPQAVRLSR